MKVNQFYYQNERDKEKVNEKKKNLSSFIMTDVQNFTLSQGPANTLKEKMIINRLFTGLAGWRKAQDRRSTQQSTFI